MNNQTNKRLVEAFFLKDLLNKARDRHKLPHVSLYPYHGGSPEPEEGENGKLRYAVPTSKEERPAEKYRYIITREGRQYGTLVSVDLILKVITNSYR